MNGEKVTFNSLTETLWRTPICPYCKKGTQRESLGCYTTKLYWKPTYDEYGMPVNSDPNLTTEDWKCLECNRTYKIEGSPSQGYKYKL